MNKALLAAVLAAAIPLAACDKKPKLSNEEIIAQAKAQQAEKRQEVRAFFSNTPELHKVLAALAERPELQGAEFGPASAVNFDTDSGTIELVVRSSKSDKLQGYDFSTDKKWLDPKPVNVVGGGKDKDIPMDAPWSEVKPDLAMAFTKADEALKALPPETVGYIYMIKFSAKSKRYDIRTTGEGKPGVEHYSMTLDENGNIVKKSW